MARRWRIRHKLSLGLLTAIAVLALLLAGTLKGLWSYYVTMKSVDAKLIELDEAELFKTAVASLALSDKIDHPQREIEELDQRIRHAKDRLQRFENAFHETLQRELTPDDGYHIAQLISKLREQFAELEKICRPADLNDSLGARAIGTRELLEELRQRVHPRVKYLEQTSADLRSAVRDGLKDRIRNSRRHYQITLTVLISVSVLSLVLMVSCLRFFYGWIIGPIHDLQQGVTRVAKGDFEHRIEVKSGDEMEELADAYNAMALRLAEVYRDLERQVNERSRQLVQSERLASVGFLAAGVAHEINNPLASIAFCSEALDARLSEVQEQLAASPRGKKNLETFAKYLKMIQEEAFRCKKITERLLEFSRSGERKREKVELGQLIQTVLDVAQLLPTHKGKVVAFQPRQPVHAWVNSEEIKSVVLNLVVNALESMDDGGKLTVELRQKDEQAEMVFTDTGCGMSAEVLENVFEPFFTRNRSGKGTGLGLTITHRIISQHDGEIEAASPGPGQGSTFRVRLPLRPAEPVKEEAFGKAA